jgi:hypothetical protein
MKRTAPAVLLSVGVLAGCGGKSSTPTTTIPAIGQAPQVKPVAASPADLGTLARQLGHRIYWFGPKTKKTYELTKTSDGRIYVRYLPPGVELGIRQATFPLVGTYPVKNAIHVLRQLAKKGGEKSFSAPKHGFAVYSSARPTNVYVAFPGSNLQIEVFDPAPSRAKKLVAAGDIVPVG